MIKLENVTLTFPDGDRTVTAVDNVNLTVENGSIAGITGPSGSGKSSLLAVSSALIKPDSGNIEIDDREIQNMSGKDLTTLRRESIGIIFQQSNLIPSLNAWEQVYSVSAAQGKKKIRKEWAKELLDMVGLADQAGKRPHQMSGGQKQRVNIARALHNNPGTLIIDEPTASLDQERGHEIISLIMKLTKELKTSTMLVTHDQSHLPRMDNVYTMIDGNLSPK